MYLSENIRYLRKQLGLTQAMLAARIGVKRPVIGAYEEGRAEPRLQTLQMLAEFFGVDIDALLRTRLSTGYRGADTRGRSLRVLPIAVDAATSRERATLVPLKAAAGYLGGFGDVEYVGALPHFSMPFPELPGDRTYRVFQIEGESMKPLPSGAYIIGEYVQDWSTMKPSHRYILLTREEGIVFKRVRVLMHEARCELISDNPSFEPYTIDQSQILEVWQARGVLSFDLDAFAGSEGDFAEILQAMERLEHRWNERDAKRKKN